MSKSVKIIWQKTTTDFSKKISIPKNFGILLDKWQCCLKSVSIHFDSDVDKICSFAINTVNDYKINSKGFIENYNPTIANFQMKGIRNQYQHIEFEKTWFDVNSANETIEIFLKDCFSEKPFAKSGKFCFLLLFQKVK